jgi:ferredoxin
VVADTDNCIGTGECVELCPAVFELDAAGTVRLLAAEPDEGLRRQVEQAVAACPAGVLSIEDDG